MCELENSKTLVPTYCHGAFNQHNVVYTQSGRWLPVNFETMHPGYPETDLAEYMRKMLEKITGIQRLQMQFLTAIAA